MAKASPLVRSMNGGEFSALMEGRTDIDRYPASMRKLHNFIAAPQGPALARSGTMFVVDRAHSDEFSAMIPFVPQDEQAKLLEITDDRIRFIDEDGLQVYAEMEVETVFGSSGSPILFESEDFFMQLATVGLDTGVQQVVLSGFPNEYGLNGRVVNVTFIGSFQYSLDVNWPDDDIPEFTVQLVYAVMHDFTLTERQNLNYVQSVDVLYLLTGSHQPRKLSRNDTYEWTIELVEFKDGPFMPVNDSPTSLNPITYGGAIPSMSNDTESFGVASSSGNRPEIDGTFDTPDKFLQREYVYGLPESHSYYAFNGSEDYWAADTAQHGYIQFDPDGGFVCDGYSIIIPSENEDTQYSSKDYAPMKWTFEGKSGGDWEVIDSRDDFVVWDNHKSPFFEIQDPQHYSQYRLVISRLSRAGRIEPRIRRLVLRSPDSASINITASGTENVNNGAGFVSTDVGRLIRLKGSDNTWRTVRIATVTDTTHIVVDLEGDPLPDSARVIEWQLGYWSNTTGWPTCGDFIDDRLWLCSSTEAPDMFAASVVGDYENFMSSDYDGTVLDDSAMVLRLNSRKQAAIKWVSADDKGVLMGTGSEEYIITAASSQAGMSAKNFRARRVSGRGSAQVTPVRVDNQVLYVQKSGRTVREFTYSFENDGYKSPSMNQLAGHMGAYKFVEMDYAAEPHSILWHRRSNNSLVGMTYNREENVVGWHDHDFGGEIIGIAVMPSQDSEQDILWMQIKRVIDGEDKYYIERLMPFWDFQFTIEDAHFVDCALTYDGDPLTVIFGLGHLEGEEVYGLADDIPFGPLVITNGTLTLEEEASRIVVGLGYEAEAETSRLENGAADGTALGKVARINNMVMFMWASQLGQYGIFDNESGEIVYNDMEYPTRELDDLETLELYTGPVGPMITPPGYVERKTIAFRKRKEDVLPFNVVAIAPQMNTQDR